ncbi:MAG: hypothetical protein ACOC9N_02105 [Gemmatimonadota bacterium]
MTSRSAEPYATTVVRRNGVRTLRALLGLDAIASGALGVVLAAASGLLDDASGLPSTLLVPAGLLLVVFAAFVAYSATRPMPSRASVWAIVEMNVLWVLASVVIVMAGWFSPTTLGSAFVLLQATVVAVFAGGQYAALRRIGAPDRPVAEGDS